MIGKNPLRAGMGKNRAQPEKTEMSGAPEISKGEIEELELVGSGQYGDVYRGRCRGYEVAIKILKNKFGSDEQLTSFKREVTIMSRIRFPNVCLLLGACTDPNYFCIVQEYLSGGDLGNLLEHGKLPKLFYARMRLASHVARGMLWIHSNKVLHRDLKLENLLMDKHGEVKVCDFGLADTTGGMKFIWDEKGRKGSPLYMAPEVLLKKGLNEKVDVYSFGLILWELLAQKRSFQHHLQHNDLNKFTEAICKQIERPPVPPDTDPKNYDPEWGNPYVVEIMKRCWADKAKDRPDFQEIYDELNLCIIDGLIKDEWGRNFWLINWPDQDSVSWTDFIETVLSKKTVQLQDGTTFNRGLAIKNANTPIFTQYLECLRIVVAQISGNSKAIFNSITMENFGKLLEWFGPGIDSNEEIRRHFLDRVGEICQQKWFHGQIDNADAVLGNNQKNAFMIRLSSIPGSFTFQSQSGKRVRINRTEDGGFQPVGGKRYDTLIQLVNEVWLHNHSVCPGSPFSNVFEKETTDGYMYSALGKEEEVKEKKKKDKK